MKLRTATFLGTLIALGGLASSVQAQTIYRIVGPDGKVREISSDRDMESYQLLNRFLGGDKQPAAGNPGK